MHHIQRKILNKLLYAESLAYSQMRPKGIESNHFAYHLEQLVKDKMVAKKDKLYELAPHGLALVDRMSQTKMVPRVQPHILTIIAVTNSKGQMLLFRRAFQPYIHLYGFPLGKTHLEETVEEAASRELSEKTGLTDVPLLQRGIVYLTIRRRKFIITKVLCHIFEGKSDQPPADISPHRGSASWADVAKLSKKDVMPGFFEIKRLLSKQQSELFFAELKVSW